MNIHGLNRLTLLDYPGHTGATVFLGSCNLRCPFCQNGSLVLSPESEPGIPEEEILSFLKKRKGLLDGVCISGGEPTLHSGLPLLIQKIKELGYLVKLDTNGTRPDVIRRLHEEGLVDFIAMDIKSSKESYDLASGTCVSLEAVCESAEYLKTSFPDYEFRTTVVRELHTEQDFLSIGEWLKGAKAYYLQAYRDSPGVIAPGLHSYTRQELESFCRLLRKTIPLVGIRGID